MIDQKPGSFMIRQVYDNEAAQLLKSTDVVTFIGILTSES
jgi:hypothetical protein